MTGRGPASDPGGALLAIDTATTRAIVALGLADGTLLEARRWTAGYRHGEELLARVEALLRDRGQSPGELSGIIVGTGPGAFTGLRVGIATAKGLAHALGRPIVGVPTGTALLQAAAALPGGGEESSSDVPPGSGADGRGPGTAEAALVLLQPAGPSDRVLTRPGAPPRILPGGTEPDLVPGERLVAVDLDGRAPEEAVTLGARAHEGLAAALVAAGAVRLARGEADDLARLVPEYVTLPRGVRSAVPDEGVELHREEAG